MPGTMQSAGIGAAPSWDSKLLGGGVSPFKLFWFFVFVEFWDYLELDGVLKILCDVYVMLWLYLL